MPLSRIRMILLPLTILALTTAPLTVAEPYPNGDHHTERSKGKHKDNKLVHKKGIDTLSPTIRDLLKQEMNSIKQGMTEIFHAYMEGDYKTVSTKAKNIEEGFILKQKLTQEQRQELHLALPHGFLNRDKEFHYLARMLSHTAHYEKKELVPFYYSRMMEACGGCHSKYAQERFPKFQENEKSHGHSHGSDKPHSHH